MMFWVPQSGDIGIGVSILSYNETVQFSLIADRHFIPDPENVIPLFRAEFEKIVTGALLHDWVEPLDPDLFEMHIEKELGLWPAAVEAPAPGAILLPARPRQAARKRVARRVAEAAAETPAEPVAPEPAVPTRQRRQRKR
jgi:hypothetical protein